MEQRRLAGAVGTDDPVDRQRCQAELVVDECVETAERLGQAASFQQRRSFCLGIRSSGLHRGRIRRALRGFRGTSRGPGVPACRHPGSAILGRISRLHSCYASESKRRGAVVPSATSRIAGDRPVPDIITELPGPKALAHVEFDETWTSPSLPRAYPIVPVRGDGLTVEDIDGNLFLDFAAGIAVTPTGHPHPQVVSAIKEQAAELIHFSASDFYLPIYPEVCREL